jgi:hypothetical protein
VRASAAALIGAAMGPAGSGEASSVGSVLAASVAVEGLGKRVAEWEPTATATVMAAGALPPALGSSLEGIPSGRYLRRQPRTRQSDLWPMLPTGYAPVKQSLSLAPKPHNGAASFFLRSNDSRVSLGHRWVSQLLRDRANS